MPQKQLFDEFQEVSAKAWKQKIQYDLRGADYNEKLVWESPEGIKVKPFYHFDDLEAFTLNTNNRSTSWKISQVIFVADASRANKKALDVLQRGAESLIFIIPSADIGVEELLAEIDLAAIELHFHFQFLSVSYSKKLLGFLKNSKCLTFLNVDITAHLASTGNWFFDKKEDHRALSEIMVLTANQENGIGLGVDTSLYQNAGANIVQQLAYGMAHINEYLNAIDGNLVKKPVFKVAIGSNYFFEIAKIRALRLLWKTLAEFYDVNADCHIIAMPSKRNKTLYGYNTNMLRTITECMSAILGGADTVSNLPYDFAYHKDNEFAERIARNQLLILKKESYFDEIDKAPNGSYYIETITEQLAEKALLLFKDIENQGGFLKQLGQGKIQKKIRESAMKEQGAYDTSNVILVGSNAYKNEKDVMKDTLELYPFVKTRPRKTRIEPIIERRLAEKSERKRLHEEGWSER